jgi:hypothetical protein
MGGSAQHPLHDHDEPSHVVLELLFFHPWLSVGALLDAGVLVVALAA